MPHVTVLWYRTNSLLSGLIRRITTSPYSHVAIDVDGVLYEALSGGIIRRDGQDREARIVEAAAAVRLPVNFHDERQIKYWLNNRVAAGYSILGFVFAGIAKVFPRLGLVVSLPGEYICSGLVATALQIGGYFPMTEARLETPASLSERLEPEELGVDVGG